MFHGNFSNKDTDYKIVPSCVGIILKFGVPHEAHGTCLLTFK